MIIWEEKLFSKKEKTIQINYQSIKCGRTKLRKITTKKKKTNMSQIELA